VTYTVLARRYRSRDFDEVVGQSTIADTLQRAVDQDRIAHAYLFCGTRGVGKTTMARIFARAINVTDELEDAAAIADAIMRGDDLDVIEIDGASNRGVQEARDLIAGAGLSPARCRCRIYIIDEVHMLTTESFNTLLKTMEEPPEHVKFILCTTEPHKVLPTIQSRCQRFDFKPIPRRLIAAHLADVVKQEGVEVDEGALSRVAELGAGSMRDALSVMDRLLAGGDTSITLADVESMLGLPETALVDAIIDGVAAGSPADVLQAGDELLQSGASIEQALAALTEAFRRMMIVKSCGPDTGVLDLPEEQVEALQQRSSNFDLPSLVHAIAICESIARQGRLGASARALFDAALVRLALASDLIEPSQIPAPAAAGTKKKRTSAELKSPAAAEAPSAAPASGKPEAASDLAGSWANMVAEGGSASMKAVLEDVEVVAFEGDVVRVRGSEGPLTSVALERIQDRLSQAAGRSIQIRDESVPPTAPPAKATDLDDENPRVELARSLFDATVVELKPASGRGDAQEERDDV